MIYLIAYLNINPTISKKKYIIAPYVGCNYFHHEGIKHYVISEHKTGKHNNHNSKA